METTPISDTIYNVIFSKYEIIGSANGTSEFKPLTINIEESKIYTLSNFIEDTDENKEIVTQIILKKIAKDELLQTELIEEELLNSIAQFDELKWSITDEALTLYWDKYEIAIGSAGAIQLDILIDDIEPIITQEGHELLNLAFEVESVFPEIKALS